MLIAYVLSQYNILGQCDQPLLMNVRHFLFTLFNFFWLNTRLDRIFDTASNFRQKYDQRKELVFRKFYANLKAYMIENPG